MLAEQHRIKRGDRAVNVGFGAAVAGGFHGQLIDAPEILGNVEVGIVAQRDRQGRATEIDFIFRSVDGLTKFVVGIVRQFSVKLARLGDDIDEIRQLLLLHVLDAPFDGRPQIGRVAHRPFAVHAE